MPKSQVRKKVATAAASSSTQANVQARVAARTNVAAPSSPIYIGIMLGLMVLGLIWLVVNYLWAKDIPPMAALGNWNYLIGFGFLVVGLIMTMRWR